MLPVFKTESVPVNQQLPYEVTDQIDIPIIIKLIATGIISF